MGEEKRPKRRKAKDNSYILAKIEGQHFLSRRTRGITENHDRSRAVPSYESL